MVLVVVALVHVLAVVVLVVVAFVRVVHVFVSVMLVLVAFVRFVCVFGHFRPFRMIVQSIKQ